jgi:methionyl-tRNA formyltransferase
MGTPEFSVSALEALITWGADVVAVVSQPDRPKGRGKKVQRTPVAACADVHQIPTYQWPRLNNDSYATLVDLKYDLAVVVAYGKILPKRYLTLPPWGCINLHGSILPKYRGAAPIQWAIMNGESKTGISVMQLDEGMDTGNVAYIKELDIKENETAGALYPRLSRLGAHALTEALDLWVKGDLHFKSQDHERATHAPMIFKQDAQINWDQPVEVVAQQIRGVTPAPGAHTPLVEGSLKIHQVRILDPQDYQIYVQSRPALPLPGTLLGEHNEGPIMMCQKGALILLEVQRPSRKVVKGTDFCRSASLQVGAPLQ